MIGPKCFAVVLALSICTLGYAHPGGLDKNGGHYDRKTGQYHYHRKTTPTPPVEKPIDKPKPPVKTTRIIADPPKPPVKPVERTEPVEQELRGKVVAITDGDTIKVLDEDKKQWTIRLEGIDAPEDKQAFGTKSRQVLGAKIHGKDVVVKWTKTDTYGRHLGDVYLGDRHVNLEMVREGMAWHFVKYSKSQILAEAEIEARTGEAGLWDSKDPQPPWDYRANENPEKPVGSMK